MQPAACSGTGVGDDYDPGEPVRADVSDASTQGPRGVSGSESLRCGGLVIHFASSQTVGWRRAAPSSGSRVGQKVRVVLESSV